MENQRFAIPRKLYIKMNDIPTYVHRKKKGKKKFRRRNV